MKKLKLLPTILMLVICVGVLAIGIYAATPTNNTINGSVTINASNHNVLITAHHVPYGTTDFATACTQTNQIGGTYNLRSGGTIDITKDLLNFKINGVDDLTHENVQPRLVVLKLQNPSTTQELGAYFAEDDTITGQLTETTKSKMISSYAIPTVKTDNTTVDSVATATLSKYTKIPVGDGTTNGVAFATIQIALNSLSVERLYLKFNIPFNIEEYNDDMVEKQGFTLNNNNQNVTVEGNLVNMLSSGSTNFQDTNLWQPTIVFNTNETYESIGAADVLRMQTATAKFSVKNNNNYPIKVSLVPNVEWSREDVTMVALSNAYIPAKNGDTPGTGEVSLQFSYNRNDHTTPTASNLPKTITGINYTINVEQVEKLNSDDIKARIQYDDTGIGSGAYKYYIEYGDNPYYTDGTDGHRAKLRWYIWAKAGGTDNNTATELDLTSADPDLSIDASGNVVTVKSNTYYFISEYVLDVSDTQFGISFNNEYILDSLYTNADGAYANDYKTSNLRRYLNGETVRFGYTSLNDSKVSAKESVNMYDRFGLTNDPLYGKISARTVEAGCTDKFWALSYDEVIDDIILPSYTFYFAAKRLSSPTTRASWRLRSSKDNNFVYHVSELGDDVSNSSAYSDSYGSRPAFQITI